ncbi:MAG: transglutaminase domain-containing protein [Oscillospiraceae bacterium]
MNSPATFISLPVEVVVYFFGKGSSSESSEEETPVTYEGTTISTQALASSLRDKYADRETVDYQESSLGVAEDQEFFVDLEFDPLETDMEQFTEIIGVYSDAELTMEVSASWEMVDHEKDSSIPEGIVRIYVRPGKYPPGNIMKGYSDIATFNQQELKYSGEYYLHEKEEYTYWGSLSRFYLALHIDTATGEPLEKPQVTIFTLESALEAPQSEFFINEDGLGGFRWNAVEGAEYYVIVERLYDEDGKGLATALAVTEDTEWIHPWTDDMVTMNRAFSSTGLSEDDLVTIDDPDYVRSANSSNFTIVAVNSEAASPQGNLHKGSEIAKLLPNSVAYNTNRKDDEERGGTGNNKYISSIGLLPMQSAITTADGMTTYRRVIYDFDAAEVKVAEYMEYDEYVDGEFVNARIVKHTNLFLPYTIEGTKFVDEMVVEDVEDMDEATIQEELDALRQRQEDSAPRGGANKVEISQRDKSTPEVENIPTDIPETGEDVIFANSALSEYLAYNMLAANETIDLSEFPESADGEYLSDAWMEAVYQNPLILGVEGAGILPGTSTMVVYYEDDAATIRQKQGEIRAKVSEIVAEVVTDDMSPLEKEIALNQYLCDTAEYDYDALESAAANDYQTTDPEFNDSFTPYGILIKQKGVCASYAGSFKLLADAAGLESIVVTGYAEGVLPHAWNRVNIDGQWHTIDVTNNDNEFLFNALLNLPDSAAGMVLVEDGIFMMDKYLGDYSCDNNSNEYYNINDRLFDKDAVATQLAADIQEHGMTTLRTDYDLNDEEFSAIAQEVMVQLNTTKLYGYHWMGVITMADHIPTEGETSTSSSSSSGSAGAAEKEEEEDEDESSEASTGFSAESTGKLSSDPYSFQFQLDGVVYSLPADYSQFEAEGWKNDEFASNTLASRKKTLGEQVKKGDEVVTLGLVNTGSSEVRYNKAMVSKITLDDYYAKKGAELLFPGGIKIGSTEKEVLAAYGEPTDTIETKSQKSFYYEKDVYSTLRITINLESETVTSLSMENIVQ